MPVSLLPDDLGKSFGVQAGRYRIVSSKWMIHRYESKDGTTHEPFLCWGRGFQPIDPAGKPIGEVIMDHDIQISNWKDGKAAPIDQSKFAPAQVPGQPLPLRMGSEGPYLEFVGKEGKGQISEKSKVGIFLQNMYKNGFDKQKFADSNMNIGLLVGTEAEVIELVSQNEGTNEKGEAFKPTKFAGFSKIYRWGYEPGAVVGMTPQGTSAGAGQVNGAPGVPLGTSSNGDAQATAVALIKKIAEMNSGTTVPLGEVAKKVLPASQKLDPKPHPDARKAAAELLKSADFYGTPGLEEVAVLEGDNVTFA